MPGIDYPKRVQSPEAAVIRERHDYVLHQYAGELAAKLDPETTRKIVDLFMEKIGRPNVQNSGHMPKGNVTSFWRKFNEIAMVKMRGDAIDELLNSDSQADVLVIFGALAGAMYDCGNRESLRVLDEVYVFAKEKMR